ncbi:MAG: exodeoxyribonuclease VII small subunit [Oscillospiraceae bacterium]|jgi:exodeoxyribonuclease VII small subunit|nr:exodeoxyribonuclease VII small subunit [Oscillospiraceae bacterium]
MKDKSLESAMVRLDEISRQMDSPELPLEDALKLYSEASVLIKKCETKVAGAQTELHRLLTE